VGQTKLVEELSLPEYSELTDQEAADAINAKLIPVRSVVETWQVKQFLIEQSIWPALKLTAQDTNIPGVIRGLCISVVDWVDDAAGKVRTVDLDLPSVVAMIGGLVSAGLATEEQATSLRALGDQLLPWPVANGLSEIGVGFVRNARKEIGG
jgi:hypothetical protein